MSSIYNQKVADTKSEFYYPDDPNDPLNRQDNARGTVYPPQKVVPESATTENLEEDQEAKAHSEEKEKLLEELNQQLESLKSELSAEQSRIKKIYEEFKKQNPAISPEENKELDEYKAIYAEYDDILNKIAEANSEDEGGIFTKLVVDPFKKMLNGLGDKIKNGAATGLTGTFTFWTDVAAKSMEKMQESLEKIEEVKAKIAAAGKIAQAKAEAGLPDPTKTGSDLTTEAGLPDPTKTRSDLTTGLTTGQTTGQTGGRYLNIKEVQKGGAAAAKRAQDSIKQFLSSSVTSSHILNMVKRKTKAKRKRNEKKSRYSRKRARK